MVRDTWRAGLYRLAWQEGAGKPQHDLFAVNPDRRESDLGRLDPEQVRGLFGGFQPEVIRAISGSDTPIAIRGQEVWRSLALILLCLLVVEASFATWAGRQR